MSSNTKNVIIDAFLELLEEKEFTKISITDITEKCNASRQTFYYHFNNIEGMLKWAFAEQTRTACAQLSKNKSWREIINPYTDFLKKHSLLLSSAIKSEGCILVLDLLKKSFYDFYNKYLTEFTSLTIAKSDDFFVNCCAASMVSYIIEEAKKDEPDYDRMMDELYVCIKKYGFGK